MKRKKGNRKRSNYPSRASISNAGYRRSKLDFCLKIKFGLPVQSRAAYATHQPLYRLHLYEPVRHVGHAAQDREHAWQVSERGYIHARARMFVHCHGACQIEFRLLAGSENNPSLSSPYTDYKLLDDEEGKDAKLDTIDYYIEVVEAKIKQDEADFNKKYGDDKNTKEAKAARKSVYDKYILLNALKNMRENYLKYGNAKIYII